MEPPLACGCGTNTSTAMPSVRSSVGLVTTRSLVVRPWAICSSVPRSRSMTTGTNFTRLSAVRVTTRVPWPSLTSAVAGMRSMGLPSSPPSDTSLYMPARRAPSGFFTCTSTITVRDTGSSPPATCATVPRKVRPGNSRTVSWAASPTFTRVRKLWGALTMIRISSVRAIPNRPLPPLPVATLSALTSMPSSTLRAVMTPSNGATTCSNPRSTAARSRFASPDARAAWAACRPASDERTPAWAAVTCWRAAASADCADSTLAWAACSDASAARTSASAPVTAVRAASTEATALW